MPIVSHNILSSARMCLSAALRWPVTVQGHFTSFLFFFFCSGPVSAAAPLDDAAPVDDAAAPVYDARAVEDDAAVDDLAKGFSF